jgi:hypothetical protein
LTCGLPADFKSGRDNKDSSEDKYDKEQPIDAKPIYKIPMAILFTA